jgi:anaerobic C4-dicarboxylate transporter
MGLSGQQNNAHPVKARMVANQQAGLAVPVHQAKIQMLRLLQNRMAETFSLFTCP